MRTVVHEGEGDGITDLRKTHSQGQGKARRVSQRREMMHATEELHDIMRYLMCHLLCHFNAHPSFLVLMLDALSEPVEERLGARHGGLSSHGRCG